MKSIRTFGRLLVLGSALWLAACTQPADNTAGADRRGAGEQTLRRDQSYFGFHFDFHSGPDCDRIGRNLTEGMIDSLLEMTRPDYIQVDCKGHPGYSSYPTEAGNRSPGYEKDILKLFREVTARHNVALYVHYSGLWDTRAAELHPDWAARGADGKPSPDIMSYDGPYVEQLLVPQMKEIADRGVDGIWIDGECWAAIPDYSKSMQQRWRKATGRSVLPKPGQKDYAEFMELNRTAFKEYLDRYIRAVKAERPDFQITSNWAYSSIMPEPVEAPVDYLSGDVAGQNGLYSAAWEARCMAPQGKPWDLMSWGFTYGFNDRFVSPKSAVMLQQEAAEVMAMGGGFQVYYQQNRDGSLKTTYFDRMAEIARFVRERQPYAQGGKPLPQIALWYSVAGSKAIQERVYQNLNTMNGVLNLLLDGRQGVEVLMDHHIRAGIDQYPLLILPEWAHIGEEMRQVVLAYVNNGGKLLVIGPGAIRNFTDELGVDTLGLLANLNAYMRTGDALGALKRTNLLKVTPREGTATLGLLYEGDDPHYWQPLGPMATLRPYGRGTIAALYCDLNDPYNTARSEGIVETVNALVAELLPEPLVRVHGPARVHVVPAALGEQWMVHLINTAGDHSNKEVFSYDQLPAMPPVEVEITSDKPLTRAVLQPEGLRLNVRSERGSHFIEVPEIPLYSIVEITF